MTDDEFGVWVSDMEKYGLYFCRYCGVELSDMEVDICDSCYDSEQLRM